MLNPKQFVKVFRGFAGMDHPDAIDKERLGGDWSTHIGDAKYYAHDDFAEEQGHGVILEGYLPKELVDQHRDGWDEDHFTPPAGTEVPLVSWRKTTNPGNKAPGSVIGEVDSVSKRQFFEPGTTGKAGH